LIWPIINVAFLRRILKTRVDVIRVVVTDIVAKESVQVVLVENHHVDDDLSLA
jgi:hypothetical protein